MKTPRLLLLFFLITIISCSSNDDSKKSDPEVNENTNNEENNEDTNDDEQTNDDTSDDENSNGDDNANEGETTVLNGIKYGPDFIVFEPEITNSDLGLWVKREPTDANYYSGTPEAVNKGYLEFTGNNKNGGTPKSPLEYTFKCPKSGKYRLVMRMYQPLIADEPGDKRNDVWIKLAGDFTTACIYPTEELKKNHKFWGRGVRVWGSMHRLEGHVNGNRQLAKVVYNLKKDENYTLTISGRAQGCSIDYIVFYDESSGLNVDIHNDLFQKLPEAYRPEIINQ